jgi:hypothetical protein
LEVALPLIWTNTGQEPLRLSIALDQVANDNLKDGYEALPRLSWLKLETEQVSINPGEEKRVLLYAAVPRTQKWVGSQWEAQLQVEAIGANGAHLRLKTLALIQLARESSHFTSGRSSTDLEAELPRLRPRSDFSLGQREFRIENVPLGRRLDLGKGGGAIKIINPYSHPLHFSLAIVDDFGLKTEFKSQTAGYEKAPNPDFVRIRDSLITAAPESVTVIPISIKIPAEKRYQGRHWIFNVAIKLLDADKPALHHYRLLVATDRRDQ